MNIMAALLVMGLLVAIAPSADAQRRYGLVDEVVEKAYETAGDALDIVRCEVDPLGGPVTETWTPERITECLTSP